MKPIEDLQWLFWDSAAALGMSAQQIGELIRSMSFDTQAAAIHPGWVSPRTPTKKQMQAAARQRRVLKALLDVDPKHRAVITLAYSPSCVRALNEKHKFGIAAPLVEKAKAAAQKEAKGKLKAVDLEVVATKAVALLEAAHLCYTEAKDKIEAERREQIELAVIQGDEQEAAHLCAELPKAERMRHRVRAWITDDIKR